MNPIFHLIKDHPEKKNMKINMKLESSWPLAWTLGQFPNIVYTIENDLSDLDFAIVDSKERPTFEVIRENLQSILEEDSNYGYIEIIKNYA